MADLKVDYQLLDATERSLSSLLSEFQTIQAATSAYDGALGSGAMAGAMAGFAGNWNDHRQSLIGSMRALGTMVSETKRQFRQADHRLTSTLAQEP